MTLKPERPVSWKRNVVANAFGRASTVVFALIFTPIYVRMLGLEAYALVAFYTSLLTMTYVLDVTFGATMTRELAQSRSNTARRDEVGDLARSLEYIYVGASLVISVASYLASGWIAGEWLKVQALPVSDVRAAVAMMGACVALQAPMAVYFGGLYGLERQQLFNALMIGLSALRGAGAILAMIIFAPNVLVFFAWQLVFGLVQLACFRGAFWYCMPRASRRPRLSWGALKRIARFSLGMAGTGIVTFFLSQINGLLLSKLVPLPQLGTFQIANQVNAGARLSGAPVETASLPRLSYHAGTGDEAQFAEVYHEACQTLALTVLPACLLVAAFAHPLISAWIGNAPLADAAAPVAVLLVLGSTVNNLLRVPYQMTVAKGWSSYGLYQNSIAAVLYLPALYHLVIVYGIMGVGYAWIGLNAAFMIVAAPIIHSRMIPGQFFRWALEDVVFPVLACGLVTLILAGAGLGSAPKLVMLGGVATGWVVSSIACALSMSHTRLQLLQWTGRIIKRLKYAQ